jgi:hypothetical protein
MYKKVTLTEVVAPRRKQLRNILANKSYKRTLQKLFVCFFCCIRGMHAGLQYDDKMANTNKATESYIHEVEKNPIIWYFTMRRFTAIIIDTLSHTVIHIK